MQPSFPGGCRGRGPGLGWREWERVLGGDARSPGTAPLALTITAFFLSVWTEASLCPQALSKELLIPPPQQGSAHPPCPPGVQDEGRT